LRGKKKIPSKPKPTNQPKPTSQPQAHKKNQSDTHKKMYQLYGGTGGIGCILDLKL